MSERIQEIIKKLRGYVDHKNLLCDATISEVADILESTLREPEPLTAAEVIGKYSWNLREHDEIWGNGTYNTIEECVAEAISNSKAFDEPRPEVIFVGENVDFYPTVDAELVLDDLEERASSDFGQLGGEWTAYNPRNKDELAELSSALTDVVTKWLTKYKYLPDFYRVENIKKIDVSAYATEPKGEATCQKKD